MTWKSVRVVKDSIRVAKTGNDRKVDISAEVCFDSFLSSGTEDGVISPRDGNGVSLNDTSDDYLDRVHFTADGSFPAKCTYTNQQTGEAKFENPDKHGKRFSVVATFNQPLSDSFCPDVFLHYNGYKFRGDPFARVNLREKGVCGPAVPPPTAVPSTPPTIEPSPTIIPSATPSPTPEPGAIEGSISVYACRRPDATTLVYDGITLRSSGSSPVNNGIWLNDKNSDNTWIYSYRITQDGRKNNLDQNREYEFKGAQAKFGSQSFWSTQEDLAKLKIKPGTVRDFQIDAGRTCGCTFDSVSYIKDPQGNLITALDNQPGIAGTANQKHKFDVGDTPGAKQFFTNGKFEVHVPNLSDFSSETSYGHDALAAVKLFTPGWKVLSQECKSSNPDVPSCPGYTDVWSSDNLDNPDIFSDLRVACGTKLEYGWILASPTPTPQPQPDKGQLEVAVFVRTDGKQPNSCNLRTLRDSVGGNIAWYYGGCEMTLTNKNTGEQFTKEIQAYSTSRKTDDKGGCPGWNFGDIPFGQYSLDISVDHESRSDIADKCSTEQLPAPYYQHENIEIKKGSDSRNKSYTAFVLVPDKDKCEKLEVTTGQTCDDDGGDKIIRLGASSFVCCMPEGGPSGGGGDGQGGCSNALGLKCTGPMPDNPRYAGNPGAVCGDRAQTDPEISSSGYGWCGPGNNACCRRTGSSGGGSPGGSNPPVTDDPNVRCDAATQGYDVQCVAPNQCNYTANHYNCGSSKVCCNSLDINEQPPIGGGSPGGSCNNGQGTCRSACGSGELPFQGPGLCSGNLSCCGRPAAGASCNNGQGTCKSSCGSGESQFQGPGLCSGSLACCGQVIVATCVSVEHGTCKPSCGSGENAVQGPGLCSNNQQCCKPSTPSNTCEKTDFGAGQTSQCNRYCNNQGKTCRSFSEPPPGRNGLYCCPSSGLGSTDVSLASLDLDNNGVINTIDFLQVTEDYGLEASGLTLNAGKSSDLNGDGVVNALDLSLILDAFGLEVN
jgi:hypothetical protein